MVSASTTAIGKEIAAASNTGTTGIGTVTAGIAIAIASIANSRESLQSHLNCNTSSECSDCEGNSRLAVALANPTHQPSDPTHYFESEMLPVY